MKVRNREEYWRSRYALKRRRCQHEGCDTWIERRDPYVEITLPPGSEASNEGWWRTRICRPCASRFHADLVAQLFPR